MITVVHKAKVIITVATLLLCTGCYATHTNKNTGPESINYMSNPKIKELIKDCKKLGDVSTIQEDMGTMLLPQINQETQNKLNQKARIEFKETDTVIFISASDSKTVLGIAFQCNL